MKKNLSLFIVSVYLVCLFVMKKYEHSKKRKKQTVKTPTLSLIIYSRLV